MIFGGAETVAVLTAGMLLGASLVARTRLCARFTDHGEGLPRVHKASLRQTVERQRKIPKLRTMLPAQIAERVVASIRANCANLYPITPDDLDVEILRWCIANGIERPCPGVVREEIAMLAGVRRKRVWLTGAKPMHTYIRERLRIRGNETERPTLYWIDDLPDMPMDAPIDMRPDASIARLSRVQPVRTHVRPRDGHVSGRVPKHERRAA